QLYTFLDDNGKEVDKLTYKELSDYSSAIAQHLLLPEAQKGAGLVRGDRALLV
ncbi:unnamed protein product, partial [Heterosigma akashiwo]